MLAEMYKKREKLAYVFLAVTVLVAAGWLIFQTPESSREWWELLFFLLPIGLSISIIAISRSHYHKVKDIEIPHSGKQLLELKELVIKKDAAFVPRLLLFEKSGGFVGNVEMTSIKWWMYPLLLRDASLLTLFPMTYRFLGDDGKTQLSFRKTRWLKQSKLEIFSAENNMLGTYIQEELKAIINIKGKLYNERQELILPIQASGFSGSFSWNDQQERRWAYFYNGMFPHEYTHLFRDMQNDIVELSGDISEEDKIRLLAVIGYLFFTRIKS
ncbi:hypothetical protein ACWNS2_16165 [Planococcus plakortidis]